MKKTLSQVGNSLALIIDKPILELLKIERDTPLEITTDCESLTIRPVRDRAERFEESAESIMDRHDAMFKRLAE